MVTRLKDAWLILRGQPLPVVLTLERELQDVRHELRETYAGRDNHAKAHEETKGIYRRLRAETDRLRISEKQLYQALRKTEGELDTLHEKAMSLDFAFDIPETPVSLRLNTLCINPKPLRVAIETDFYRGLSDQRLVEAFIRRVGDQLKEFMIKELDLTGRDRVFGTSFSY